MTISKSDYMLFLKHPAWLWVKKNDPSKIPPIDENTQALFDSGNRFESLVELLFPEGVSLGFSDYNEYLSLPKRTKDALDDGDQVLFQPRFEWNEYTCICDIVSFVGNNELDLYEIKASTSVKPEHEHDLAFQVAVLEGIGYEVRNIVVIHVNNHYVRQGEIEPDKITSFADITDKVRERGNETAETMLKALAVAGSDTMPDPDPSQTKFGYKGEWLRIYANLVPSEPETDTSHIQPTILHDAIKDFLSRLRYPLYFLDYETLMSLVPYFDGHQPYQQIPFQYSLHYLETPESVLGWKEYLHRENSDPSRPLTEHLIQDIGNDGSVIVWYEGFEKARNSELGEMQPEFKEAMKAINDRVVDLMIPFKNKWYHDPRLNGSASIKQVLPVVAPHLSYKKLGIQNGSTAQRLWMETILDETRATEKDQILADLLEYCKLDTLAMVEIFNVLRKL